MFCCVCISRVVLKRLLVVARDYLLFVPCLFKLCRSYRCLEWRAFRHIFVDVCLYHLCLFFMTSVYPSARLYQRFVIGARLLFLELRCYRGVIPSRVHSIVDASYLCHVC